jgi:hypothetical protein
VEDAVDLVGVDDAHAGAAPQDGERLAGLLDVEVALGGVVLLPGGVGGGQQIGRGLEVDGVVLPVSVGGDDGGAEAVDRAVRRRRDRVE